MDKWKKLKLLMEADISHAVHYSLDKNYEHGVTQRYLRYMKSLEKEEQEYLTSKVIDDTDIQGLA